MRIFVIGATGVLGRALVSRFQQEHHDIRTLVRSSEQARLLQAVGIEATVGEILQTETQQHLPEMVKGCEAVIHIATAIPSNPYDLSASNWETNTRLRTEGARHLLAAALEAGVARYIQQSITMAYTDGGDAWLDEAQPFDTSAARAAICAPIVEMEQMVRAVPVGRLQWSILRGGLFVGPGTGQEKLLERLRAGQVEIPGQGQNFLSPIHIADMAEAIALALEHASGGSIYHIVNQPLRYGDYITGLADRLHLPHPPYNASLPEAPSYRCRNQHAREQLGWQPQHTIWPGEPSW